MTGRIVISSNHGISGRMTEEDARMLKVQRQLEDLRDILVQANEAADEMSRAVANLLEAHRDGQQVFMIKHHGLHEAFDAATNIKTVTFDA